jgi:hypothetical protein
MTDYSHQSIDDIMSDIETWILSLQQIQELFHKNIEYLNESGYWDEIGVVDFQFLVGYALKFYQTSEKELAEILEDIKTAEIQTNHVTRLSSMAETADKLNRRYGAVWHKESFFKDYQNPDFRRVEKIYAKGRDMAVDMLDLDSLAIRLNVFIGRKGKADINRIETSAKKLEPLVDPERIEELRGIHSQNFDLVRLIRMCEELNECYSHGCFYATAMLTRAILDHIPPIFGCRRFSETANNYAGSRSFKESMMHLENSSRKIADAHLHQQIRLKETLPNRTQVNFSNDLDVLLAEIVRILK